MNFEDLDNCKGAITELDDRISTVIDDRRLLIEKLEHHIAQYFDCDKIDFSSKLDRITLYFGSGNDPVISSSKIHGLGMDFSITMDCECDWIVITCYPLGISED